MAHFKAAWEGQAGFEMKGCRAGDHENVFGQPYGMGMGLTLFRMIIDRHGGKLSASSGAGAGARFDITLPVEPAAEADQQADETAIAVVYPRLIQPHLR